MSTQPLPKGRRLGIITNTGGPGVQPVDTAIDNQLVIATWSKEGKQRLAESLHREASLGNPVDVVATAGPSHFHAAVDTLLRENDVDMVLVYFVTAPFVDQAAIAKKIEEATSRGEKPVVCVVCTLDAQSELIHRLRNASIPVYEFAEHGIQSLGGMARYQALLSRPQGRLPERNEREKAAKLLEPHLGNNAFLPLIHAFDLLDCYGIDVPRRAWIPTRQDMPHAALHVGFPCVLKAEIEPGDHKSNAGGVILGIEDGQSLTRAYDKLHERFGNHVSVSLFEQKPPGREIIIGSIQAPSLGPLMMVGLGGVFVELMNEVAFSVAPLTDIEARDMLPSIRGINVLDARFKVDLDALAHVVARASLLVADFPDIVEMDLNPVLAYPRGQAPVAVDARIRVR
jgi:acetyltransferase